MPAPTPDHSRSPLEVGVGQRTLAGLDGEVPPIASYGGFGARHVAVVAAAREPPVATRLGPQRAASAILGRARSSLLELRPDRLAAAFQEAHSAVARAAEEARLPAGVGAGVVAALLDPGGLTVGRVGRGRAILLMDGGVRALFRRPPAPGYVGDGRAVPEIVSVPGPLPSGARLVLLTDGAAAAVSGDVDALTRGVPPQRAALNLTEAARRRGHRQALAALVLEVASDLQRERHPAAGPVAQRLEPPAEHAHAFTPRRRPIQTRAPSPERGGLWFAFLGAALAGGAVALATTPRSPEEPVTVHRLTEARGAPSDGAHGASRVPAGGLGLGPAGSRSRASGTAALGAPDAVGPDAPAEGDAEASGATSLGPQDARPVPHADRIARALSGTSAKRSARRLSRYLRKRFRRVGYPAYREVGRWVEEHPSPHVVETLLEMMKRDQPKRTRRWLAKLMAALYKRDAAP